MNKKDFEELPRILHFNINSKQLTGKKVLTFFLIFFQMKVYFQRSEARCIFSYMIKVKAAFYFSPG